MKVIRNKYKCGSNLIPIIDRTRSGSNTWNGIKKAWEVVEKGMVVNQQADTVRWRYDKHGEFSVKSAYINIAKEEEVSDRSWLRIWKLNTIARCKTFIWTAMHNSLLTNEERCRRNMAVDDRCHRCRNEQESLLHVLRDCEEAKQLWKNIGGPGSLRLFFEYSLLDWLTINIKNTTVVQGVRWCDFFATICWLLWRRRNEFIFQEKAASNDNLLCHAKHMIVSMTHAKIKLSGVNLNSNGDIVNNVKWVPPIAGWVKLNIDGACTRSGLMGCGGLLRVRVFKYAHTR